MPISFQTEPFEKFTVSDIPVLSDDKVTALQDIQDGSQIKNVEYNILTEVSDDQCLIYLKDDILNPTPISESFVCGNIKKIQLNNDGMNALQYNLADNKFEFEIKSDNKSVNFAVINTVIDYDTPSYFAEIKNDVVTNVIVAEQSFIDQIGGNWIETKIDGSIRGHYAVIGDKYDLINNVFITPVEEKPIITGGVNATK